MTVTAERELCLLAALEVYRTWHSAGFLAGKGLIPLDWPRPDFYATGDSLAEQGLALRRWSEAKDQPMYHITWDGIAALAAAGKDRTNGRH